MSDGIHTCHDKCPRLACVQRREIERLTAEVEALRADAERYRWLRDNRVGTVAPEGIVTTHMELTFTWYSPTWENGERCDPVSLDAAIDRARGKA